MNNSHNDPLVPVGGDATQLATKLRAVKAESFRLA